MINSFSTITVMLPPLSRYWVIVGSSGWSIVNGPDRAMMNLWPVVVLARMGAVRLSSPISTGTSNSNSTPSQPLSLKIVVPGASWNFAVVRN